MFFKKGISTKSSLITKIESEEELIKCAEAMDKNKKKKVKKEVDNNK